MTPCTGRTNGVGYQMNVSVVGCGYVGLTCAVCLARLGNKVVGIDVDRRKIELLRQRQAPIYEAHLLEFLEDTGDNLSFTNDPAGTVTAEVVFLAVPTPVSHGGKWDLSYLQEASRTIGRQLNTYTVVINKCTAPVGTTDSIGQWLVEAGADPTRFSMISNPEFLKQSTAILDFLYPNRIVLGGTDAAAVAKVLKLYRPIIHQEFPFAPPSPRVMPVPVPTMVTTARTAEMIKYASNSFLAAKISFINEIGNISKRYGVDVYEVARGMGQDPRISPHFLEAGLGFGGSCLPKDTRALISMAQAVDYEPDLLKAALRVNERQPRLMIEMAKQKIGGLAGKKIAVLGTAFKPGTDDMRESSAVLVVEALLAEKAVPVVYDPMAMASTRSLFGDKVVYGASAEDAVRQSDCVLVVTAWEEFKNAALLGKPVIDGRRLIRNAKCGDVEFLC